MLLVSLYDYFVSVMLYHFFLAICFQIETVDKTTDTQSLSVFRYCHPDPVYILFNPWCQGIVLHILLCKDYTNTSLYEHTSEHLVQSSASNLISWKCYCNWNIHSETNHRTLLSRKDVILSYRAVLYTQVLLNSSKSHSVMY